MSKIKKIEKKHFTLSIYLLDEINDVNSAIRWINDARRLPELTAKTISLNDMCNRNDEGNTSIELASDIDIGVVSREIAKREIDDISLTGKYKNNRISMGINLNDYKISVSVENKNATIIDEIEMALGLND